jgi:hypothetical protein
MGGSDVTKPIAAPIEGDMITSMIHVLIPVPVFFAIMKERALKKGTPIFTLVVQAAQSASPTSSSSVRVAP